MANPNIGVDGLDALFVFRTSRQHKPTVAGRKADGGGDGNREILELFDAQFRPGTLHNLPQRDGFEEDMAGRALVEDADRLLVDHRQATVAPAVAVVDAELVLGEPAHALVEAGADRHILAVPPVRGVGEKQQVDAETVLSSRHLEERGHADRIRQPARAGMFRPGLSAIAGQGDGAAGSAVVAHREHQHAGLDLRDLRFGRVAARRGAHLPGLSPVAAEHDGRGWNLLGINELHREHERPVGHHDAAARALESKVPLRLLDLRGEVSRRGPAQAVVVGDGHHELGCFARLHALSDRGPGALAGDAVGPCPENVYAPRIGVREHGRVAHAVLGLGPSAPLAHVQHEPHRFPGPAAVRRAAHAYVDVGLEVVGVGVADVIDGDERAFRGRHQPGDAVGGDTVVTGVADGGLEAFLGDGGYGGGSGERRGGKKEAEGHGR